MYTFNKVLTISTYVHKLFKDNTKPTLIRYNKTEEKRFTTKLVIFH